MIRTLVAEPTAVAREGLVSLLHREDDIEVIAALERGTQVVPTARSLVPDVALVAVELPGQDGFASTRALHAEFPECNCAILSRDRNLGDLRRALASHAIGFLVHDSPADFITDAVRKIAVGKRVIDPDLALAALDSAESPLTARETDALRMAKRGSTTVEIANTMCLSVGTVRNYLSHAIVKTGARNRVDAIRIADESGWL